MERIRLLIVDDEAFLLRALTRLLRDAMEVQTFADPRAALDAGPCDVALIDVDMPGMSGWALADALTLCRPALRVLFMTGLWPRTVPPAWIGAVVLAKPFDPSVVIEAIRTSTLLQAQIR